MRNTTGRQIFVLIVLTLFLRIYNFSFPTFTADEARIANRGYMLYTTGADELGRKLPYIFNAQDDYQLPLASYASGLGTGIFGKSELGARFPFILLGLILVLLTYKVSTQLSRNKSFHILSALIVATSPVLIFISKVPNELIIAATLLLLLFYFLNKDKLNIILIFLTIILLIFTSKFAWFILTPFVIYTVFSYRNTITTKNKLKLSLICLFFTILVFAFFLQIPQGRRSLLENNLSLFSDISTINGINRIRGQGQESGWPPILGQILINKSAFFVTGMLHWLSNIQPSVFFSQFSKDGNLGFTGMGAFPKATIIPALIGLVFIIRKKSKLLLYPIIVTLPAALIYPQYCPQIVILTLPFVSLVIAFGLIQAKKILGGLLFIFMIMELFLNIFFISPQVKATDKLRPSWIKPIIQDVFKLSDTKTIFISDNITQDPASFLEWYTSIKPQADFRYLKYPYKLRQTNYGKIKFLGQSDSLGSCKLGEKNSFFVTKRDLDRVRKMSANDVVRTYLDSSGRAVVYFVEEEVCIN